MPDADVVMTAASLTMFSHGLQAGKTRRYYLGGAGLHHHMSYMLKALIIMQDNIHHVS